MIRNSFFRKLLVIWRGEFFTGVTISLVVATSVSAIARDRDSVWHPAEDNALWRKECGACHMAFPAGLLGSADWQTIMAQLDKHFGVDASLDLVARDEIAGYLEQNGAGGRASVEQDALPRITMTTRFESKHRSAIRLWRKGQLKSLGDCGACHKEAGSPR
jgi:hypothetical protein